MSLDAGCCMPLPILKSFHLIARCQYGDFYDFQIIDSGDYATKNIAPSLMTDFVAIFYLTNKWLCLDNSKTKCFLWLQASSWWRNQITIQIAKYFSYFFNKNNGFLGFEMMECISLKRMQNIYERCCDLVNGAFPV